MTVEIIHDQILISPKVWDQARIELTTPGSAVRNVSAARHVTDCASFGRALHFKKESILF